MIFKILFALTIVLECVTVPIFLKHYWPEKCVKSMAYKMISATLFVLCGFFAIKISGNNTPYADLIMWGLAFGWLGDLLLHWLKDKMAVFALGVVAFLTGHIFYIIAFQKAIETTYPAARTFEWYEILFVAVVIIAVTILAVIKGFYKERAAMTAGLTAYGVLLLAMLAKTARYAIGEWAYGTNDNMVAVFITVLGGGLFFAVSDILLGYILMFKDKKRILRIINIVTYFIAQILLASSILVVRSAYPFY